MENRYWKDNNGVFELHFEQFYEDSIVLKFIQDEKDNTCCRYCSDLLKVEEDYEFCDTIEEAKELFEDKVREHILDELNYYDDMLNKWDEKSEQN